MSENIGLIAGKGQFPLLFAQAARQQGAAVIAVAHRGETDPALAALVACFALNLPLGVVQNVQNGYQEGFVISLWESLGKVLGLIGVLAVIFCRGGLIWLVQGASLDEVYTLTPTTVLDTRLNFTRMDEGHSLPSAGFDPSRASDPAVVVIRSAVAMLSLMSTGMPWSGPRGPRLLRSASIWSAIARALGLISSAYFAAPILGVPLAAQIADRYGWRRAFLLFAILALVTAALSVLAGVWMLASSRVESR
jgi:hypothetical protein